MPLENNQRAMQVGKLYKLDSLGEAYIDMDLNASIWINAGEADLYCSDSATQPTALSQMTLNDGDTGLKGKTKLGALPTYIAIVQNGDIAPTEIVITGIEVNNLGDIS